MTNEQQREAFEENTRLEALKCKADIVELLRRKPSGAYLDKLVEAAWRGWQACEASRQQQPADVEVLKQYIRDLHQNQDFDFVAAFPQLTHQPAEPRGYVVERVAKAIYEENPDVIHGEFDETGERTHETPFEALDDEDKDLYLCQARAALSAIPAPVEAQRVNECNPPHTCVTLEDYNTILHERDYHSAMESSLFDSNESLTARIADYEEALADTRRLTRELDIAMHGKENAAKQASLCDLIPLAKKMWDRIMELEGIAACAIHDKNELARRNALLRQRDDLPVDRIPAHDELVRLQARVRELEVIPPQPFAMSEDDVFKQMLGALQATEAVYNAIPFASGAEIKKLKRTATKSRKAAIKLALYRQ